MDHQLQIVGFTPAATRIINLVASDVGRPVGQIVSNLVGYDSLVDDVRGCASCRGVGSRRSRSGREYSLFARCHAVPRDSVSAANGTIFLTVNAPMAEAIRTTVPA